MTGKFVGVTSIANAPTRKRFACVAMAVDAAASKRMASRNQRETICIVFKDFMGECCGEGRRMLLPSKLRSSPAGFQPGVEFFHQRSVFWAAGDVLYFCWIVEVVVKFHSHRLVRRFRLMPTSEAITVSAQ